MLFLRRQSDARPPEVEEPADAGFRRGERGFTFIEMMLVLALTGMLAPVIVTSLFQIVKGTDRTNTENVALADIDAASTWIGRDLTQAQTLLQRTSPTTTAPLPTCSSGTSPNIRIEWVDETLWADADPNHSIEYSIDPGTTRLIRNRDGLLGTIGRHVTSITFCQDASGIINTTITTLASGATATEETNLFFTNLRAPGS